MPVDVLKEVFGNPRYNALALASAAVVFIFATLLPNLSLVWQISTSASVPLLAKVQILSALTGSIGTNFTFLSAAALIVLAVLFGANMSLLAYGLHLRRQGQTGAVASVGGLIGGLLGVGCATCGTFVLTPLLSLIGAASLLAALPFGGEELTVLGIALLAMSLLVTGRSLAKPLSCMNGEK